jgi:O-antigen/teichoic acid export membrane protein
VHDLKKNFLSQLLLAVSQILFPLITYPYVTRTLGPEGIGKVGYIDFIAGFVISIFSIGIPFYGVREIAKLKKDKAQQSKLTGELLVLLFLSSVLAAAVLVIILLLNKNFHNEKELIFLGTLYVLLQTFAIEWYLQGTEAFSFITWRNIILRIFGIIAIFLFVKKPDSYIIYYLIIVVTQFLVVLTTLIKAFRLTSISFYSLSFKQHVRPLFYFFLTTSFISVYVFFDTIILGFLSGKENVGYYTLSLRLIKLPLMFFLILNTVLYPRVSYLHTENKTESISNLSRFTINFIITITIPVCICYYLLSPEIINVFGGKNFAPAATVLQILSPLPLLISFSNFFTLQILYPLHREKWIMIAVCIACVVSISFNFWLIPQLKERGAAIAVLVTETVATMLTLAFSFGKVRNNISIKNILISMVLCLVAIPVVLFFRSYFGSSIIIITASLILFGLIYASLQYFIFKNEIIKAAFDFAKNILPLNKIKS